MLWENARASFSVIPHERVDGAWEFQVTPDCTMQNRADFNRFMSIVIDGRPRFRKFIHAVFDKFPESIEVTFS